MLADCLAFGLDAKHRGRDQAAFRVKDAVIQGVEHEDIFNADLELIGSSDGQVGDVNGFAPPGDIHRVHNTGDEVAISLHVYGTDVTRVGSSVRRYYD